MPSPLPQAETATFTKVLVQNSSIPAHGELRLTPNLDVKKYDRIHLHIGRDAMSVAGMSVRVLFSTPMSGTHCSAILADSTVWFEETVSEREFIWTAPPSYNRTGFIMSVPVVAPMLFDVILTNTTSQPIDKMYVALMAQEI